MTMVADTARLRSTTGNEPDPAVRVVRTLVTPAMAEAWLETNTNNRRLKQYHVDAIRDDILGGRWIEHPAPIQFDRNRMLIDGQHRLHAIVKANTPTWCWVAYNCDTNAKSVIDQNVVRTTKDVLVMRGEKCVTDTAACARLVWSWNMMVEAGPEARLYTYIAARKFSNGMALEVLSKNPDIRDAVAFVNANKEVRRLFLPSVGAFLYWLFAKSDPDLAGEFLSTTAAGAGLSANDPRLILGRMFVNWAMLGRNQSQENRIGCTIKAWNAWRTNQPVMLFRFRPDEKMPRPL